ncbi:class I SAM-dependent methyltransferase [Haloechinothrix salitolerans]|uniref:Class I SAM-dependent methyltransferase n=1 Tax=Haloechinothrix salitolerans TaxID=926830 RepID=A0ABW2BUE4_9PSEU
MRATEDLLAGSSRTTEDLLAESSRITEAATNTIDQAAAEEFAERLLGDYTSAMVTLMIDIGHRTGLFDAAAAGPGTSDDLAQRAGLTERYVREWLGAITTAGITTYDPLTRTYTLPAAHAACLTGGGATNVAPLSLLVGHLGTHIEDVAKAFREGGGVPYEKYRPGFTDVMDGINRGLYDGQLIDGILPLTGDLPDRLRSGIRAADIGCGTGHALTVLATAFPASTFVGYDIAADAIDQARAEAADAGLDNVTFEVRDVAHLPADARFDAVFAFDAIHDQADPDGVLRGVHDALVPGGSFVAVDIKASSHLENNVDNPLAPMLYAVSTLHCMTVSLACGGAGLGTVWGEELARQMFADAGFEVVSVNDVPDDPIDILYHCRRP